MLFAGRIAGSKNKAGPVKFVFDAGGHNAHHTLVKIGIENANGRGRLLAVIQQRLGNVHGLLAHVAFNVAALPIDGIQLLGQFIGFCGIVGGEAFNAQRHV